MFDEELITWSIDGGGRFFYRPKHKFSVTNVSGYMRAESSKWNLLFVYYLLDFQHKKIAFDYQTKAHPSVIKNLYYLLEISTQEQKQIAEIFSTIDRAIAQTEAIIAKQQRIKTGLMQDLLTKGIDENGNIRSEATHQFKDSAIGCIPVEWDVLNLESIVDEPITYGIVQAGLYIEGGIPYIRTGDMSGDSIPLDRLLRTSKRIADAYKRSTVYQMDIVFALRATVGKVLPIPQELNGANLTQGTAKISPSSNFDENFILWALRTSMVSQQILAVQKGTTFFEITLSDLRQLLLAVPKTKAEQTYISHCLITCEQKIQDEKRWLLKQKNTKTGLMQDLLTGKVRVTNLLKEKEPTIP